MAEQPIYFQVQFALDRVKVLAPKHPEWKEKQPFKALLAGDMKGFTAGGAKALAQVIAVSHSVKLSAVDFVDDKEGKPIGIQKFIGRRPIFAFGNSDGDHQMLQWTTAGSGLRFMGLVHHTDAEREWGLRPRVAYRKIGQGARRSHQQGLDRRGHETGLESGISV